jgi:hypothetical protein
LIRHATSPVFSHLPQNRSEKGATTNRMGISLFGKGIGRICAVVAAPSAREMASQLLRAWRETPTVELRLDWLKSDSERRRLLPGSRVIGPAEPSLSPPAEDAKAAGSLPIAFRTSSIGWRKPVPQGACGAIWKSKPCASFPSDPFVNILCLGTFCYRSTTSTECLHGTHPWPPEACWPKPTQLKSPPSRPLSWIACDFFVSPPRFPIA